jgi:REP element-mobilizing transposase RayT
MLLREHAVAEIVGNAITHFDGKRYELIAWPVMPNHVHVVLTQHVPIASVIHSWKSFTAKKINALLGRTGELWEKDYWDHAIRNSRELERTVEYVVDNPIAAGFQNWPFVARYDERLSSLL